jgi:hypothetical protein
VKDIYTEGISIILLIPFTAMEHINTSFAYKTLFLPIASGAGSSSLATGHWSIGCNPPTPSQYGPTHESVGDTSSQPWDNNPPFSIDAATHNRPKTLLNTPTSRKRIPSKGRKARKDPYTRGSAMSIAESPVQRTRPRHNLNEGQRRNRLQNDEDVLSFCPTHVTCAGCGTTIKLDDRNGARYYPTFWLRHKGLCAGVEKLVSLIMIPPAQRIDLMCFVRMKQDAVKARNSD